MRAIGSPLLEFETALAGGIGQGFDPAMKHIGTAVENDLPDAGFLGALGKQLSDDHGRSAVGAGLQFLFDRLVKRRGCGQRTAGRIVDDLRVDMLRRAKHGQPRARFACLAQFVAHPLLSALKKFG